MVFDAVVLFVTAVAALFVAVFTAIWVLDGIRTGSTIVITMAFLPFGVFCFMLAAVRVVWQDFKRLLAGRHQEPR